MSVSVMLFTSDLRVHDQPALAAAVRDATEVVPLFVRDPGIHRAGFDAPNRRAFLADCLASLDDGLRRRGGRLVVRSGDVVDTVCRVVTGTGARSVHIAAGVSGYAAGREEALAAALAALGCALRVHDGVITALPPGRVTPANRDHFAVFTPYFRRWAAAGVRPEVTAPRRITVPEVAGEALPARAEVAGVSPGLAVGGEEEGRRRVKSWLARAGSGVDAYEERHDDLAGDATSRLSPHLHFGTLSATELVRRARDRGGAGAEAFVRQLAWRDFHHQVLAARPDAARADYRTRGDRWRDDEKEITAWREGRTGCPIVDAGMRQLRHEGWMHNRARLLTASYLAKTLYADWRTGAAHFLQLLVDGDMANNQLNWQWVAGTGTDTRPNRILNPLAQARRFDADGSYVRRWVPELASVPGPAVHDPAPADRARLGYPAPLVDLGEARDRFSRARGLGD
ncbi:cryptochrome/photolyase family protein [Streptomyces qinzhouensis]|uniref:Deoxyribodipyrimidine photo-lyase n=1 Tax=Streptomyces qinzhouensis TaxID=2599401 RepID=A0A5B8JE02_9ACTN|nr:deoxyribodipyrimidine photo-lyase [Streptomyces qinzhouensis]QDY75970.1 deoxyribodipyrimidine photo-lyase [Streptomyces qinzhouensis]